MTTSLLESVYAAARTFEAFLAVGVYACLGAIVLIGLLVPVRRSA